MCFSAGASFASGVVISTIGILAVRKVSEPSQRTFSVIPLLFGLQQFAEGFLWLSLKGTDCVVVRTISTYVFLFTAQVVWSWLIPLSVLLMEEDPRKKKILRLLVAVGVALSIYYAYYLVFHKVASSILDCHILYSTESPDSLALPTFILYLAVTIIPFFVSGIKRMFVLGIIMALSCLVAALFYKLFLTSVWCFFAAIISVFIYLILRDYQWRQNAFPHTFRT
jgi:hypothetical protein